MTDTSKRYRRKGMGTIFLAGNCYYGKIMVGGKLTKVKLTANKRQSEQMWAQWLDENRPKKTEVLAVKHPIGDIWATVRDGLLANQMSASIPKYFGEWEKFAEHFGRDTALEDITRGQIVEYLSSRLDGKSSGTQNAIVAKLRRFYSEVLPDLKNSDNPLYGFKTIKDETISRQAFSDDEIKRILESAAKKGPDWDALFHIGLYTGLRFTDCVHLRRSQIKDGVIYLTPKKTMRKTGTAVQIPLHPILQSKLDALASDGDYFLPELVAMTDEKRTLMGYYVRQIFHKAGIKTDIEVEGRKRNSSVKSFHALRATFISRLAQSSVGMGIIKSIAGHVGEAQTQAYVHPDLKTKTAAIDVLPDFTTGEEAGVFIDETIQRILDAAKAQIEEVLERKLDGKKIEVRIGLNYRLLDFAKANAQDGETPQQTLDRLGLKWKNFKEKEA